MARMVFCGAEPDAWYKRIMFKNADLFKRSAFLFVFADCGYFQNLFIRLILWGEILSLILFPTLMSIYLACGN